MTELYTDHLYLDSGIMHVRVYQLKGRNQRPEYKALRTVASESEDVAYLIGKISVLDKPFEDADVASDRIEAWVCGCPDFHFHQSDGVENGERKPSEMGHCKHLRQEVKHIMAESDDSQRELM